MIRKIAALTAVAVITALLFIGCKENNTEKNHSYQQISQEEAMRLMSQREDLIILDVRTVDEYNEGHIPSAVCVPNESITDRVIPELPDKDQLILVYCRSGRRSKEAAQKLADLGYSDIREFGGIISWTGKVVTD